MSLIRIGTLIFLAALAPLVLAETLQSALDSPQRLQADRERDARSRPDEVLPLLGLQAGDRVADIFAGGGYYSELIGRIVSPDGEVLLLNNLPYRSFAADALAARFAQRSVPGVRMHDREPDKLDLGAAGSLDAALIIMSYHDLFYADQEGGWPAIDRADFMRQIVTALKVGGRFLIVDHQSRMGAGASDAKTLHRLEQSFAVRDIESFGLRLLASSDALRNPDDDHSLSVFDPAVSGHTDRYILVFEKAAELSP